MSLFLLKLGWGTIFDCWLKPLGFISLNYSLSMIISYLNNYKHLMNNISSMPEGKQQIANSFKSMEKVLRVQNEPIVDLRVKN
jgi:hypothetical protein